MRVPRKLENFNLDTLDPNFKLGPSPIEIHEIVKIHENCKIGMVFISSLITAQHW